MSTNEFSPSSLENLPSMVLATRLEELMTGERHSLCDVLLHLAAFDRQRAYLDFGYDSLFVFCTDCLKMSNGTAHRRTTSARLIARFPAILEYLRDGRVSTASLCELRDALNEANHREILDRASGLNEHATRLLAATLTPKPALADSIRRVPVRTIAVLQPTLTPASDSTAVQRDAQADIAGQHSCLEPKVEGPSDPATPAMELTFVTLPPKPSELEPLSAERFSIRMTVSKEFIEEFRELKNALSHVVPGGKMEDVFRECMRIAREACERRTRGSKAPRVSRATENRANDRRGATEAA